MKVAMMIANEMLVSHAEEIKHLSKEALRHEIKLIVDKDWASSDPEKLIANVEQEIRENLKNEEFENVLLEKTSSQLSKDLEKNLMSGTYVIKSAPLSERSFEEWCQDIIDIRRKYKEGCFSEKSRYGYKIPKPIFTRPVKLDTINSFYRIYLDDI